MSFLHSLAQFTGNVGRGVEDLFTLGGTELARKFGGQGAKNVLNPLGTAMGANFEAGAAGGAGILGAHGLGAFGAAGAPTAGVNGMTTASGATGMGQGMAAPAAAASPVSQALSAMRGMPMGGGQQQPAQISPQQKLQKLYEMYPNLRPHLGGM